jgi:hypothetical protein
MSTPLERVTPRLLLLGAALVAVVLGVLTVSLRWFTNVGLAAATLAVIAAAAVLTQRMVQTQRPLLWQTVPAAPEERRGADSRVSTLRHQIELAAAGQDPARTEVQTLIATLAQDRLLDQRGVDLGTDARGAALLGPDLAAYLDHPPQGRLTTDALHRHVQTLEELS